jgi:hypothetical protein
MSAMYVSIKELVSALDRNSKLVPGRVSLFDLGWLCACKIGWVHLCSQLNEISKLSFYQLYGSKRIAPFFLLFSYCHS